MQRFVELTKRVDALEKGIKEVQTRLAKSASTPPSTTAAAAATAGRRPVPADLSALQPCPQDSPEVAALRRFCLAQQLYHAAFTWVPSDYYSHSLQWRRDVLAAPTIHHLCKSILLENTHCVHDDCSHRENARFYLIVYQYTERFDAELVMRVIKEKNEGLGKKKFNFRLADPAKALELTGFGHGAVAPFGTKVPIPVILSESITRLSPAFFIAGGGHVDCKVRLDVQEFIEVVNPIVANITVPLTAEELEQITD